ncbi:MAG: ABC transporter permease subunit [Actinomycetota bacterium]|jgi:arabinogalactan oligomer/maltooligosaccharide transport system permease protein
MRKRLQKFDLNSGGTPSLRGTLVKILLLGLVDAGIGFVITLLFGKEKFGFAFFIGAVTLLVNWIYLRRGGLPAKYLAPGVILLLAFQVYVVCFSGYISTTNYGTLHNGSFAEALDAIQQAAIAPIEGATEYELKVARSSDGALQFIAIDTAAGKVFAGGSDYKKHPFHELTQADGLVKDEAGYPTEVKGLTFLTDDEIVNNSSDVVALKVPLGPDIDKDGFLATVDGYLAQQNKFSYVYDEKTRSMVRLADNKTFIADGKVGFFKNAEDGELLSDIGWQVNIGTKNYSRIFTDKDLRGPLTGIIIWTFLFAFLSVFTTFVLGLILALIFNDSRIRGLRIYRAIFILPYAFPAFLSAYVWRGMFNTQNGFINRSLLSFMGDNPIPWLEQQGPARAAVLLVNLWLGFPYMFLICTGALQAIPSDLSEAASIDGASAWKQIRAIKLPLLLVSLAPLLIASFAYNFNNFGVIYLVTAGGPFLDPTLKVSAGATDILITFVYRIAFSGSVGADYGLASAFSVLIFLLIGSISFFSFKRTRGLEELTQ